MHPKPEEETPPAAPGSRRSSKDVGADVPVDANLIQLDADENNLQDHDDDIIFEDFARLRLKGGETDA
jgi:beta-arrestin